MITGQSAPHSQAPPCCKCSRHGGSLPRKNSYPPTCRSGGPGITSSFLANSPTTCFLLPRRRTTRSRAITAMCLRYFSAMRRHGATANFMSRLTENACNFCGQTTSPFSSIRRGGLKSVHFLLINRFFTSRNGWMVTFGAFALRCPWRHSSRLEPRWRAGH